MGETPFSIPNRAVKSHSADGTRFKPGRVGRRQLINKLPNVRNIQSLSLVGWAFVFYRLLKKANEKRLMLFIALAFFVLKREG